MPFQVTLVPEPPQRNIYVLTLMDWMYEPVLEHSPLRANEALRYCDVWQGPIEHDDDEMNQPD